MALSEEQRERLGRRDPEVFPMTVNIAVEALRDAFTSKSARLDTDPALVASMVKQTLLPLFWAMQFLINAAEGLDGSEEATADLQQAAAAVRRVIESGFGDPDGLLGPDWRRP